MKHNKFNTTQLRYWRNYSKTSGHPSGQSVEIRGIILAGSSDEEPMDEEIIIYDKSLNSKIPLSKPSKKSQMLMSYLQKSSSQNQKVFQLMLILTQTLHVQLSQLSFVCPIQ